MAGETVGVRSRMKYLGLVIDSQWRFEPHFDPLIPKVSAAANALCGLLPNIGGAAVAVRRLCEGVVRSRVICGTQVWADDLMASRRSILLLRRLHSVTAIRIIRGYRTMSHASSTALAPPPPVGSRRALALKRRYGRWKVWDPGEDLTEQAAPDNLGTAEEHACDHWRSQLINEGSGLQLVQVVLPVRRHGGAIVASRSHTG
ncbi:uncharacterized protein LOC117212763 [Bombus bifarius]|uniref:Uncharacterized protein LOC117212763 n=1 Tax=Bombus bifarius TaxID=103933 RepID=A0A6P8MYR7_9HYME|nr:uncharacterized protein LOC117212763 [Bombus bifarius]